MDDLLLHMYIHMFMYIHTDMHTCKYSGFLVCMICVGLALACPNNNSMIIM